MDGSTIVTLAFAAFFIVLAWSAIKVVPQSKVFVVERFGKFSKTLPAGINIIIPIIIRSESSWKITLISRVNCYSFRSRIQTIVDI